MDSRPAHAGSNGVPSPQTLDRDHAASAPPAVAFEWEMPRAQLSGGRSPILDALAVGQTLGYSVGHAIGQPQAPERAPWWKRRRRDESVSEVPGGRLIWTGDIDAILGYSVGEFGRNIEALIEALHVEDRARVLEAMRRHLQTRQPFFEECRARCKGGSFVTWTFSGVATRDEDDVPCKFTGIFSNIVHDKHGRIEAALQAQVEKARAESLLRTASHLNAQLDLQDVCEAICDEAARTLGAPSAVMLFDKGRDAFVPTATRDMPKDYAARYTPTSRSIYDGHVREMGTLFLFRDAQATPDLPNHKLYREVNMRTIGIASLIREGEVLGLLKVYSFNTSRTFDENELALLQGLADQAALAISNARFFTESQRRLANLQALRQIDMAILGSSDVHLALNVVLDQVVSRLGSDASSVLLLNPHTRMLRYAGGRGFRTATPRRTDWKLGEGLAGRAALERRMIHVPDLSRPDIIVADFSDPELKLPGVSPALDSQAAHAATHEQRTNDSKLELPEASRNGSSRDGASRDGASQNGAASHAPPTRRRGLLANEGFVSYHAVPLVAAGQVKGVLEVWHRSTLRLDEEDLEFLETLAGQAAIAIDNASLFRDLQRTNDELRMAYDSTLEGWSGALDLRDKETEGHSQRVTEETLRLAQFMGLSDAELVQIRRGALLHDIGKMGIPDAILHKPGKLSDEEWDVMKKHPTYALELLSPIKYLRGALDVPYSHHEKWDGTGYPRGLSGEQIPLAARIFAVIDVWDALCSDRPYRQGWPQERVLEHIQAGSGTHFDPAVVRAFLQMHAPEHSPEPPCDGASPNAEPALQLGGAAR